MEWNVDNPGRHAIVWKMVDSGWSVPRRQGVQTQCMHSPNEFVRRLDAGLVATFAQLRHQWLNDSAHISSMTARVLHASYQRIIGMGRRVVPLLLLELKNRPAQWTWALRSITGEDPVARAERGNLRKEATAWLAWGQRNGLI
jgi:hypothetical protein